MPVGRSGASAYVQKIIDSLKQVSAQQEQVRQENTTVARSAVGAQTPGQGLMQGVLNGWRRQIETARAEDDAVREQAMAFLDSIPDTPENRPIKIKLALDMMMAKPGKSSQSWHDRIFRPEPNRDAKAEMLAKIQAVLPTPEIEEYQMMGGATPGYVNLQDTEDGNFEFSQPMYDQATGEAIVLKKNRKTGQITTQRVGALQDKSIVIAGLKGKNASQLTPQEKKQFGIAEALANSETGKKLADLTEEEQNQYWVKAGEYESAMLKAKLESAKLNPELKESTIERNRDTAAGKVTNESGQTTPQVIARNDAKLKEGEQIQTRIGQLNGELAAARTALTAAKEAIKVPNPQPGKPTEYPQALKSKEYKQIADEQAKVNKLETTLRAEADTLEGNYKDYYQVSRDENGLPTKITRKATVGVGEALPKAPRSKQTPRAVQAPLSWDDNLRKNAPRVVTGNGITAYMVTDSMDMKGNKIMKHPQAPAGETVFIIERSANPEYESVGVNNQVLLAGRMGTVVYVTPNRIVVKID